MDLLNDVLAPLYPPPSRPGRKVVCKLQDHDTKRPDVYSDGIAGRFAAGLHLGRHITMGTAISLQAAALGEAKVCQFDVEGIAGLDKDVLRLEVPVGNRLGLAVKVYERR
jgi:hypothetical protein